MKKPTLDILDAISPEYSQYQNILPPTARYITYTSKFSLSNEKWEEHYNEISAINFNWQELRYRDVVNRTTKIDKVVPKTKGVYIFLVKPVQLIFNMPQYVYYVGIAGANGGTRTLRERLKDYFSESNLKKRDAVRILIYKHYESVYIAYSTIMPSSTLTLEEIERSLIGFFGTHILANKDDIPIALKPQAKAFNI